MQISARSGILFSDLSSLGENGLLASASISRPGFEYPTSHVSWLGKSIQVLQTFSPRSVPLVKFLGRGLNDDLRVKLAKTTQQRCLPNRGSVSRRSCRGSQKRKNRGIPLPLSDRERSPFVETGVRDAGLVGAREISLERVFLHF